MKRYNFSEIQGNPTNDILASGTLVVDNDNNLRLHDGTTNGGNIVGASTSSNSVVSSGTFSTLPDFLDFYSGTQIRAGQNNQGIFFSGNVGDSEESPTSDACYPIRTNFTISGTTKSVTTVDMVVNDECSDFGLCVFEDGTQPKWMWAAANNTRIAAQYNCVNPEISGLTSLVSPQQWSIPENGTYRVRFTYDPNNTPNATLETLDTSDTVLDTITLDGTLNTGSSYRIGFAADQDTDNLRTYIKNLSIAIDGGDTYSDTLIPPTGSLDPYVTIVDSEVNVTTNINFVASESDGVIVTVENSNDTVRFYQATGDSDGNTYTIGHAWEGNGYSFVYAFDPNGTVLWKQAITINDQQYPSYLNGLKVSGSYVYVGGTYYNGTTDSHFVLKMNTSDGGIVSDQVFRTPTDTYPDIYDIDVDGNDNMIYAGRYGNETLLLSDVPVAGSGQSWAYFENSNLQGNPSQSGYGGQWKIETSPGVFENCEINHAIVPVTNTANPSATGMIAAFRYDQNQSSYWGGYLVNGGTESDYTQGDLLKVPGSLLRGIDGGTTVVATPSGYSSNGSTITLSFSQSTYPDLFTQLVNCSWQVTDSAAGGPYEILTVSPGVSDWLVELNTSTLTEGEMSFYTANGNDATWNYNGGQLNNLSGRPNQTLQNTTWLYVYNAPDYTGATTLNLKTSLSSQAVVWSPNWFKSFGISDTGESFDDISYDGYDNSVYLAGDFWDGDGNRGAVFKLSNTDGSTTWSKFISDGTGPCYVKSVLPDGNGNVYTVGVNNNGYTLVTKLDSNGDVVWQSRQTNNNNWNNEPRGSLDSNGNVYVTGSWDTGNNYVTEIIKINGTDGTLSYSRTFYNNENYDMNEFDNEDNQHTAIAGNSLFWAGYCYDVNDNNEIGVAIKMPIDGSVTGTFGRWHIDSNSDTTWEDCSGEAQLVTATYNALTPSTTTVDTGITSVSTDIGSSVANESLLGGTTAGLTGVNSITFSDGTTQTTAAGSAISWTNPNGNTWRIEEYNGGASVTYNGNDYDAKWFDIADSTSGSGNFRGAIIQYHAYCDNAGGTIIGTIHLGNDYSQEAATHTEHMSGNSNLQSVTLWACNNERGQLYFKRTDGSSSNLLIQWTAKIFYGSENYC